MWISSVEDVAFVDELITDVDRVALLAWARERFDAGDVSWRTQHRNYATTRPDPDWPPPHDRLRARVEQLLDLPPSAIYEGSFISFHGPGGEVIAHTDGAPPGMAQLRCNVMLEPGEEGGELVLADQEVRPAAGESWVFFSSDVKHGCLPLRGNKQRIFCAFLFRLPLAELGAEEGQRRATAVASLLRGECSVQQLSERFEVEAAEVRKWQQRVLELASTALRPAFERDRIVIAEQLRRISYELDTTVEKLEAISAEADARDVRAIVDQLRKASEEISQFPPTIGLPTEQEIPAGMLVRV